MANFGGNSKRGSRWYLAVFWGGLIAGVVDISAAFLNLSRPGFGPVRILQGMSGHVSLRFSPKLWSGEVRPEPLFLCPCLIWNGLGLRQVRSRSIRGEHRATRQTIGEESNIATCISGMKVTLYKYIYMY